MRFVQSIVVLFVMPLAVRAQSTPQSASAPPAPPAASQTGQSTSVSINVRLVELTALVRDARGELVHGLTRDDFEIFEDGQPRPIRYFNAESDLPLTLGLMVDTSTSMRLHAWDEHEASAAFLEEVLTRPQDRAFLLRFDAATSVLQPMTNDVWQLKGSLWMLMEPDTQPLALHASREVAPSTDPLDPALARDAGPAHGPSVPRFHGGTLLLDSIVSSARSIIGKEPGRRALVVLTDGYDQGSQATLDDAIHAAQNANVAVYSVLYLSELPAGAGCSGPDAEAAPPSAQTPETIGRAVMGRLSRATGGRCFVIGREMPVSHAFALIEQDLRSQYRLGFTPQSAVVPPPPEAAQPTPAPPPAHPARKSSRKTASKTAASKTAASKTTASAAPPPSPPAPVTAPKPAAPAYHSLELKTRNPQYTVQARSGYYDTPQ